MFITIRIGLDGGVNSTMPVEMIAYTGRMDVGCDGALAWLVIGQLRKCLHTHDGSTRRESTSTSSSSRLTGRRRAPHRVKRRKVDVGFADPHRS